MKTQKLTQYLDTLLKNSEYKDYCYNGLQFEGKDEVKKIGLAVDACMKTYKHAIKEKCDMVICHHGFIWKGLQKIDGPVKKQIAYLLKNNLNIYGVHLPLDAHAQYGNNIQLIEMLEAKKIRPFGDYHGKSIGFQGELPKVLKVDTISDFYQEELGGDPLLLPFGNEKVKTVAIVSGGGSSALPEAIEKGIDLFITGESSHQDHHIALEGGINVLYLGHYHSEQIGVIALGKHLEEKFRLKTIYLDEPTLV